jgi:hypothetical protein
MKKSVLSRSMTAVAAIAVGSVALAAVPASAATPSGITREQVLTAAAGVRSGPLPSGNPVTTNYGPAANRALKAMANRACGIDPDGNSFAVTSIAAATASGGSAEGVVVTAMVFSLDPTDPGAGGPQRLCTFAALAATAERSVLSGTATVAGGSPVALSGDAFVTPAVFSAPSGNTPVTAQTSFTASGNATQSNVVKVKDKKSKKEKRAAKAKYDKRLKAAKKSYKKALDKAGSSKSKKAVAKKAWSAKKKAAKAKYKYAVAGYKLVTRKTATPFNVSAQAVPPASPNQP